MIYIMASYKTNYHSNIFLGYTGLTLLHVTLSGIGWLYLWSFSSMSAWALYRSENWYRHRCFPRFLNVAVSFPSIPIFFLYKYLRLSSENKCDKKNHLKVPQTGMHGSWDIQTIFRYCIVCVTVTCCLRPQNPKQTHLWNRTRIILEHINSPHGKAPATAPSNCVFFCKFVYLLIVYSVFFYFAKRCICKTLLLYIEKHLWTNRKPGSVLTVPACCTTYQYSVRVAYLWYRFDFQLHL